MLTVFFPCFCFGSAALMGEESVHEASAPAGNGSVGQIVHLDSSSSFANYQYFGIFTGTAGTVSYGHVYLNNYAPGNVTLTLYSAAGTVLAYGSVLVSTNDEAWYNVTLNTPVVLTATTYYCSINSDDSGLIYDDNATTGNTDFVSRTYSGTPTDITPPGSDLNSDNLAILFNNTAGSPE